MKKTHRFDAHDRSTSSRKIRQFDRSTTCNASSSLRRSRSVNTLDPELRLAYLDRLGLEAEPPSVEALQRLHRRHVERVPYETLWIHAAESWGTDPSESVRRIAQDGRGGYCYHLNGALAELLGSLGYDVHRHVGGVHGPDGPTPDEVGNHLVLTVRGLPSNDNPSGVWYVDAGLGDALHQAIPLVAGEYRQGPFLLGLEQTADADWHLTHDPQGGFGGMRWSTGEATWGDFADQHAYLSTSPESGFVRIGMAQCRDADGVDCVRGLVVRRIGSNASKGEPLTNRSEWFAALRDLCGLHFDATPPEVLDRLWDRSLATHRAWEATKASE